MAEEHENLILGFEVDKSGLAEMKNAVLSLPDVLQQAQREIQETELFNFKGKNVEAQAKRIVAQLYSAINYAMANEHIDFKYFDFLKDRFSVNLDTSDAENKARRLVKLLAEMGIQNAPGAQAQIAQRNFSSQATSAAQAAANVDKLNAQYRELEAHIARLQGSKVRFVNAEGKVVRDQDIVAASGLRPEDLNVQKDRAGRVNQGAVRQQVLGGLQERLQNTGYQRTAEQNAVNALAAAEVAAAAAALDADVAVTKLGQAAEAATRSLDEARVAQEKENAARRQAYEAGYKARGRSKTGDMEGAEARYVAKHGPDADMFRSGWMDKEVGIGKWTQFREAAEPVIRESHQVAESLQHLDAVIDSVVLEARTNPAIGGGGKGGGGTPPVAPVSPEDWWENERRKEENAPGLAEPKAAQITEEKLRADAVKGQLRDRAAAHAQASARQRENNQYEAAQEKERRDIATSLQGIIKDSGNKQTAREKERARIYAEQAAGDKRAAALERQLIKARMDYASKEIARINRERGGVATDIQGVIRVGAREHTFQEAQAEKYTRRAQPFLDERARLDERAGKSAPQNFWEDFKKGFRGSQNMEVGQQWGQTARFSVMYGAAYQALSLFQRGVRDAATAAVEYTDAQTDLTIITGRSTAETSKWADNLGESATAVGYSSAEGVRAGAQAIGLFDLSSRAAPIQERVSERAVGVAGRIGMLGGETTIGDVEVKLAGVLRAFGDTSDEITGLEDELAVISKQSGRTSADLLEGLARIGTLAGQAGFDRATTMALIARITTTTGGTPTSAADALNQVLSKADNPEMRSRLRGVGVNVTGTTLAQQTAQVAQLVESGKINGAQLNQIISAFGRGASGQAASVLLTQNPAIRRLSEEARNAEPGTGAEQFAKAAASFGFELKKLVGAAREAGKDLALSGMFDSIGLLVKSLTELLRVFDEMLDVFNLLPRPARSVVFMLGEAAIAAKLFSTFRLGESITGLYKGLIVRRDAVGVASEVAESIVGTGARAGAVGAGAVGAGGIGAGRAAAARAATRVATEAAEIAAVAAAPAAARASTEALATAARASGAPQTLFTGSFADRQAARQFKAAERDVWNAVPYASTPPRAPRPVQAPVLSFAEAQDAERRRFLETRARAQAAQAGIRAEQAATAAATAASLRGRVGRGISGLAIGARAAATAPVTGLSLGPIAAIAAGIAIPLASESFRKASNELADTFRARRDEIGGGGSTVDQLDASIAGLKDFVAQSVEAQGGFLGWIRKFGNTGTAKDQEEARSELADLEARRTKLETAQKSFEATGTTEALGSRFETFQSASDVIQQLGDMTAEGYTATQQIEALNSAFDLLSLNAEKGASNVTIAAGQQDVFAVAVENMADSVFAEAKQMQDWKKFVADEGGGGNGGTQVWGGGQAGGQVSPRTGSPSGYPAVAGEAQARAGQAAKITQDVVDARVLDKLDEKEAGKRIVAAMQKAGGGGDLLEITPEMFAAGQKAGEDYVTEVLGKDFNRLSEATQRGLRSGWKRGVAGLVQEFGGVTAGQQQAGMTVEQGRAYLGGLDTALETRTQQEMITRRGGAIATYDIATENLEIAKAGRKRVAESTAKNLRGGDLDALNSRTYAAQSAERGRALKQADLKITARENEAAAALDARTQVLVDLAQSRLGSFDTIGRQNAAIDALKDSFKTKAFSKKTPEEQELDRNRVKAMEQQRDLDAVDLESQKRITKLDPRAQGAIMQERLKGLRDRKAELEAQGNTRGGEYQNVQQQIAQLEQIEMVGYSEQRDAAKVTAGRNVGGYVTDARDSVAAAKKHLDNPKTGELAYTAPQLAYDQALQELVNAQLQHASVLDQLSGDITAPREQAKAEVAAADRELRAADTAEERDAARLHQRQARAAQNRTRQSEWLSDLQDQRALDDISQAEYLAAINERISQLQAKKKLTYDERKELTALRKEQKSTQDELSGQWNIGDIKLPTPYEMKRGMQGTLGTTGQSVVDASTNQVTINGADMAQVVAWVTKYLGKDATLVTSNGNRRS